MTKGSVDPLLRTCRLCHCQFTVPRPASNPKCKVQSSKVNLSELEVFLNQAMTMFSRGQWRRLSIFGASLAFQYPFSSFTRQRPSKRQCVRRRSGVSIRRQIESSRAAVETSRVCCGLLLPSPPRDITPQLRPMPKKWRPFTCNCCFSSPRLLPSPQRQRAVWRARCFTSKEPSSTRRALAKKALSLELLFHSTRQEAKQGKWGGVGVVSGREGTGGVIELSKVPVWPLPTKGN